MSKLKKIFISLGVFITSSFTKIFGIISRGEEVNYIANPLYGPPGEPQPTTGELLTKMFTIIAKPLFIVVVFIIGLIVVLNKKMTKKVKAIVISILILLAILGYVLISSISVKP